MFVTENWSQDMIRRKIVCHTLRHTATTWLMQAGANMDHAAALLGMEVETLRRVYGHHHPELYEGNG